MTEFRYVTYIKAPVSRVWSALVDPATVSIYHMVPLDQETLLEKGEISYGQGLISGSVTELVEGERLVHSFRFAHRPDDASSRVSYELETLGPDATCLTLVHDEFEDETTTYHDVAGGWPTILSQLKTYLETGTTISWPTGE